MTGRTKTRRLRETPAGGAWRSRFVERFGRAAAHAAQAPGRVNLIGEHVDYSGGWVLPMAIDRRTIVAAAPASGVNSRVASTAFDDTVETSLRQPIASRTGTFADRLLGVAAGFQRRGATLPELDILVDSDVPIGGGLSSSAALEVAAATLFEQILAGAPSFIGILAVRDKALLCQRAEHEFAGVPAGIMDMFVSIAATEGHAVLLDCRSLAFELVPFPAGLSLLVVDTRVAHDLADGEYARRRRECEEAAALLGVPALRDASEQSVEAARRAGRLPPPIDARALHVTGENRRTLEFAAALRRFDESSDPGSLGRILLEGHASLRDRFQVSCPELDFIVDIAASLDRDGALGARMTGGGFGGSAIVLCRAGAAARVGSAIAAHFQERFGHEPNVFEVAAADGAGPIRC